MNSPPLPILPVGKMAAGGGLRGLRVGGLSPRCLPVGLRAGARRDDSPGSCCRLDRMFTASRPPVAPRWADMRRLWLCPHRVTPPGLSGDESCTTKSQVDDDSCQPIGIRPAFLQAAACPPPRRPRRAHARPEQRAHDAAGAAAAPRRGHPGKRGHAEGAGAEASGADPGGNLHKSEMARNTTLSGGRLCRHRWGACGGGSDFLSDAPHPPPACALPLAPAPTEQAGRTGAGFAK